MTSVDSLCKTSLTKEFCRMHPRDVYEIWTHDKSAVYVGISVDYEKRFRSHQGSRSRLRDVIKSGATVRRVAAQIDEKEAARLEESLISKYRRTNGIRCLNVLDGGQMGSPGPRRKRRHSPCPIAAEKLRLKWMFERESEINSLNYDDFTKIRRNRWLGEISGIGEIHVREIREGRAEKFKIRIRKPFDDVELLQAVKILRIWGIKVRGRLPKVDDRPMRFEVWTGWKGHCGHENVFDYYKSLPVDEITEYGEHNQSLKGWRDIERLSKRLIRTKHALNMSDRNTVSRDRMLYFAKDSHRCGDELKQHLKEMMSMCVIPEFERLGRISILKKFFGHSWWILEIAARANPRSWQAPGYWKDNLLNYIIGQEFTGDRDNYFGEEMLSDGIVALGTHVGDKELFVHHAGYRDSILNYPRVKRRYDHIVRIGAKQKKDDYEWDCY